MTYEIDGKKTVNSKFPLCDTRDRLPYTYTETKYSEQLRGKVYYSVPNLEFNWPAVNGDHTSPKLDSNSEIMHWLKPLVSELQQQTRFPHSCKKI